MSERGENICLAVVLALLALALGSWGIYSLLHPKEEAWYAAGYSYALKGEPISYPDVFFEVVFAEPISEQEREAFCGALADKMFENIDEDDHYLHYMDFPETEDDSRVEIYVDFGCNDGTGLDVMLEFLDTAVQGIAEVRMS